MTNTNLFFLFLFISSALLSCKNADTKTQDLLVSKDSVTHQISDSLISVNNDSFVLNKAILEKAFLAYLPDVSGGREFNKNTPESDGKGYKILLADLNGDNLPDGIVDYSLEPTLEDNGGGGNAVGEIPGLVAFINTGKGIIIADHSESFSLSTLKKVNNGVIILEGLAYAEDDPRCCPSIKTTTRVVLRNNKLTELY